MKMSGFQFELGGDLDNEEEDVEFVEFDLGYHEGHKWRLNVSEGRMQRISQLKAVKKVEEWLSKPLTEEYFEMMKDDTDFKTWNEATQYVKYRGDLLGKRIWLRSMRFEHSVLYLELDL
jgi:hypothetical protein